MAKSNKSRASAIYPVTASNKASLCTPALVRIVASPSFFYTKVLQAARQCPKSVRERVFRLEKVSDTPE